jgi:fumarate reductase subunit D
MAVAGGTKARPPYRLLDSVQIIDTARRLERRVAERFPEAGLRKVSAELVSLASDLANDAKALEAPIWWLRLSIGAGILAGGLIFLFIGTFLPLGRLSSGALESVESLEAMLNTLLLAALGLLALVRSEERIKRKRVFRGLHGLRSLIHVIDMHQLTKDPTVLSPEFRATEHSPQRITEPAELARYLDYCSEMLSITGKIAALFAQSVNDEVVIEAVNDIETLSANLSRKIWQKITLIDERISAAKR